MFGLRIGRLGAVARAIRSGFSPSSLFAAGEQGAWYDPSDLTTLFQDSAGTTPVTAVQQPVGLMLDKSKGLVLGPELVTNGDFSNGTTGWGGGNGATIAVVSSALVVTRGAGNYPGAAQSLTGLTVGRSYRLRCNFVNALGLDAFLGFGGFTNPARSTATSGTLECTLVATATSHAANVGLWDTSGTAGQSITFDNISVKELPGNHAFQTTSASRPVLSARYNLLTKTDSLGPLNGWASYPDAWTGNYTTAPDGTNTAMSIKNVAVSSNQYFYLFSSLPAATYRLSVWAKPNTGSSIDLFEYYTNLGQKVRFSLVGSGSVVLNANGYNAGISKHPTASDWYYCFVDIPTAAGIKEIDFVPSVVNTDVFMWRASVLPVDQVSLPYQRVNTSTDYDTVGFKPYLAFDGVDDSLVTNSIDFTGTDKMTVFAGVRKLSDATVGAVAELSANSTLNSGAFILAAPGGALNSYFLRSRGTSSADAETPSVYSSPITNTVTALGNIASDVSILRINGTQTANSIVDQGTGNYGNYPLFIGRRNQATLPLNARLYSLIVRGAASTTAQITSTETWVNQRTGAYT